MTTFKVPSVKVPAKEAFWYRMALLDVQQGLVDAMVDHQIQKLDLETLHAIFNGVGACYDELRAASEQVEATA